MEINAEINRVVGEQMAVLLADRIPDEELDAASRKAWENLTYHEYKYGKREESQLEKLINERIVQTIIGKVDKILNEPKPAEEIQAEAERIAEEAKKKAYEMIVNTLAKTMCEKTFMPDFNGMAFREGCSMIAGVLSNRR